MVNNITIILCCIWMCCTAMNIYFDNADYIALAVLLTIATVAFRLFANLRKEQMKLYHATTQKKAKAYRKTGFIKSPVRGFNTQIGAMAWAMKVGRTVIIEFEAYDPHKLPDHHNQYGCAWWNDGDIKEWKCVFSANGDA